MTTLKVGCSPLTGAIYAGHPLKDGSWVHGKKDVTAQAVDAVAQHLLIKDARFMFDKDGKSYAMEVVELIKKD